MTLRLLGRLLVVLLFLATVPAIAFRTGSHRGGMVTDLTEGASGVTITAVHQATGNKFMAVTDERGVYRVAARAGVYTLTAELQGFRAVTREGLELRVGQVMTVNLPMLEATAAETVTVTAESPLLNVATSSLGGNVDPRQIQELPVNGRNWIGLALLAPGSKTLAVNATTPLPDRNGGEARGVPAEHGRSTGLCRYRDRRAAAIQPGLHRGISVPVEPVRRDPGSIVGSAGQCHHANQAATALPVTSEATSATANSTPTTRCWAVSSQSTISKYSATLGGPLVQDKLHYFVNYEYEREPRTSIWNTPYPEFNVDLEGVNNKKIGGVRLDYQLSTDTRLMGKVSAGRLGEPFGLGNAAASRRDEHDVRTQQRGARPVVAGAEQSHAERGQGRLRVLQPREPQPDDLVESLAERQRHHHRVSAHYIHRLYDCRQPVPPSAPGPGCLERPRRLLVFVRRGRPSRHARRWRVPASSSDSGKLPAVHGDGRCQPAGTSAWPSRIAGADSASGALSRCVQRRPWNLAAISPLVSTYSVGLGDFDVHMVSQKVGLWAQDDWQISSNLTLNLGLRWDGAFNAFANDIALPPFQEAGRPNEMDNIQPRIGFAWKLGERTVIRGGTGLYYGDALGADQSFATGNAQIVVIQYANDGRADFAANPTNGQPLPTYDQALRRFCYNNGNLPGCLIRDLQEFVGPFEYVNLPRTFQASIGFQRQLGDTMSFEADYVYSKGRDEKDVVENINLSYNPATGANNPSSNRALRPYPDWGVVSMNTHLARSAYHALQTGFQKRFADRWQGSATYTVSGLWNADTPPFSGLEPVPFATVPDLGGEWGLSSDDQRHRAVFSGIWEVGRGFQVSALHFFAAGLRLSSSWGADLRRRSRQQPTAATGWVDHSQKLVARAEAESNRPARPTADSIGRTLRSMGSRRSSTCSTCTTMGSAARLRATSCETSQPVSAQTRTAQFGFRLMF